LAPPGYYEILLNRGQALTSRPGTGHGQGMKIMTFRNIKGLYIKQIIKINCYMDIAIYDKPIKPMEKKSSGGSF